MDKGQFQIEAAQKGTTGTVVLTGYISNAQNASSGIRAALDTLNNDSRVKDILFEISNCYGGSVYEGFGILHYMRESAKPINTKVIGIAASMAFPIFLGGSKRTMTKNSRLMMHEAQGNIQGSAGQVESFAAELKQINEDLLGEIVSMTGKDETYVVANLMRPGIDTYVSAQEAFKLKLATEKPNASVPIKDAPQALLESNDPMAVYQHYRTQITNSIKPKNMEKLPLMAAALGLAVDATEEQVLKGIQNTVNAKASLENENKTLKTEKTSVEASLKTLKDAQEAQQTQQIESMVAAAIQDGKVKKEQEESLKAWAKTDFVGAQGFLDGIAAPHTPISAQLNQKNNAQGADASLANKSYKELMQTPEGSKYLEQLMASDAQAFAALKEASYPTNK